MFYVRPDVYGESAGLRRRLRQPDAAGKANGVSRWRLSSPQLRAELAPARVRRPAADAGKGAIGVVETTHPVNMAALQRFFVGQGAPDQAVRQANLP